MESLIHAFWLGLVEGVTEFLPISSTGHLVLLVDLLGIALPPGRMFEVFIQFGAILAIIWVYRARLLAMTRGVFQANTQLNNDRALVLKLCISFLPAAILGLLFYGFIKEVLFSPLVIAVMLILGGGIILLVERANLRAHTQEISAISWRVALIIGFAQALAMIPGTSRSGATIIAAMLCGTSRRVAADYTFLLAIPTMAAASGYELIKHHALLATDDMLVLAVGFVAAFVAALLSVKFLLRLIQHAGYTPFAWYRIALGLVILGVIFY